MVQLVTVSSSKGGAGKTTAAICLADWWSQSGIRIGLLDTDPTQSLSRWYDKGQKKGYFQNIEFRQELHDKKIIATARELSSVADLIVIDVAGIASTSLLQAAGIADLVIIPAQPNEDDFFEAVKTRGIVLEAMEKTNRSIPCKTLITRGRPTTRVLGHTLLQMEKAHFPLFSTILYERTVYPQARFNGQTPISYEPLGAAAGDVRRLADEILAELNGLNQIRVA